MLKVLHVGISYLPSKTGGFSRFFKLATNMKNVDISVITPILGAEEQELIQNVSLVRYNPLNNIRAIISCYSQFKTIRPDKVVCHGLKLLVFFYLLKKLTANKFDLFYEIHDFHSRSELMGNVEGYIFRNIEGVVVMSESAKGIVEKENRVMKSNICVVKNGYDKKELTNALRHGTERVVFSYVGSFYDWQGVGIISKAIDIIPTRYDELFEVLLVGEGPLFSDVESKFHSFRSNIKVRSSVSKVEAEKILYASDVVLMPRLRTTGTETIIPLKFTEALAYNKALIISDVGGLVEPLPSRDAAIIVEPNSPDSLAEAMIAVIKKEIDIEPLKKVASESIKYFSSWDRESEKYRNFLERKR